MIRNLIYDFDGTLVDSLPAVVHGTNAVLKESGFPVQSREQVIDQMKFPTAQRMGVATGINNENDREILAVSFYRRIDEMVASHPEFFPLCEGILPLLSEMNRAKIRQCIVSNNKGSLIRQILISLKIDHYFDLIIGEEDMPAPKPDPRGLLSATHPNFSESVYIGDSPVDALAAKNAGIPSIGVTWGIHSRHDLEKITDAPFNRLVDYPGQISIPL